MSMSMLVRALGAAAGGASKGMDEAEADRIRKKKEAQDDEDRAFNKSERDRLVQQRADMGAAAAPVTVDTVQPAGPVDPGGQGAAAQPIAPVQQVQGRAFDTPEAATAAAAAANTPQAVTARMADVAMRNGDPVKAQALRTGAVQEQTQQLQLGAAQRADINARFNDDLQKRVNSWDSFDQFISDSTADGQDGGLKVQSVVSPDGKTRVVNKVLPDGSLVPTGKVFPNTSDGLAQASAELARLSPEQKLTHLHQQATLAQQAAQLAEQTRHNTETEKTGNNNTEARIEMAQIRADSAAQGRELRAQLAAAKTAQPAAGMTFGDLKDGHKGIASTLNADWKTQIESTTDPVALKALKVARENEIGTVQRLYTGAMQSGFALTPEQAIVAFRSGETAKQTFKSKDGSGTVTVEGVMYGGRFIPMADNPGAAVPSKPAPKPADPRKPNDVPNAPEPPGMLERGATAVKGLLDSAADTGMQIEAIRKRVKEADNGGTPLTAAERATAKKNGITPLKG